MNKKETVSKAKPKKITSKPTPKKAIKSSKESKLTKEQMMQKQLDSMSHMLDGMSKMFRKAYGEYKEFRQDFFEDIEPKIGVICPGCSELDARLTRFKTDFYNRVSDMDSRFREFKQSIDPATYSLRNILAQQLNPEIGKAIDKLDATVKERSENFLKRKLHDLEELEKNIKNRLDMLNPRIERALKDNVNMETLKMEQTAIKMEFNDKMMQFLDITNRILDKLNENPTPKKP